MTTKQILNFLNSDEARNAKITRINFVNGEMVKAHFNRNDQIKELADENIWFVSLADRTGKVMEFNGEDIKSLSIENLSTASLSAAKAKV